MYLQHEFAVHTVYSTACARTGQVVAKCNNRNATTETLKYVLYYLRNDSRNILDTVSSVYMESSSLFIPCLPSYPLYFYWISLLPIYASSSLAELELCTEDHIWHETYNRWNRSNTRLQDM